MIRIALVEDEAEVRAQLQGYVQRHTRQYGTEFAVTEFADGMELLDDYRPVSSPSVFATARTGCGVFAPDTVCGGSEPASVSGTAVSPVPSGSTTAVCRTAASSVIPAGRER